MLDESLPVLDPALLRESVSFSVLLARESLEVAMMSVDGALDDDAAIIAGAALSASDGYLAGGTRNAALRKAAMDAFRVAQTIARGPMFHAIHAASAAAGAAFLHPPGGSTDAHQTKHILGAAVHYVLCHEASGRDSMVAFDSVVERIPDPIKQLLRMYPEPVAGKQRYGAVLVMLYQAITQSE
ncbi:MAG: hypothetical protein RLZZ78_737 [Armatimonadota bacterium]|jgi:hypothetical protein